jgi:squalene monooxygenase
MAAAAAAASGVGFQLIGAAAATLLAAVLVAAVLGRRRRRARPQAPLVEAKPAPEGGCAVGDGRTDVIIVGAGVAGSALAYTLGKVGFLCLIILVVSFVGMVPLGG